MKPENAKLRTLLRTDEGMKIACVYVQNGFMRGNDVEAPAEFFKGYDTNLFKRYNEDAAFRAGFDAMVYAAKNCPDQYGKAKVEMEDRDARYGLTRVFSG